MIEKYTPTDIYCVWIISEEDEIVEFLGQLPREGLDTETVDLPDWVFAKYYNWYDDDRSNDESLYEVRFGNLNEFLDDWLVTKMKTASFSVAGIRVI